MKKNIDRYTLKKNFNKGLALFFKYIFLLSISYIVIFQIVYMISYAIRPDSQMYDPSIVWIPKSLSLENFKTAIKAMDFYSAAFTTVTVHVISGIIEIFSCAIAAYGFARFNFPGKNLAFTMVLITILVPSQMISVPMYLSYANFDLLGILGGISKLAGSELRPNLLDTGFVFYLPSIFGVGLRSGLFIFIYRQFFKGLPKELEEAAYIDGANAFKTFTSVIWPSSGVAVITVAIFSVIWHWNEYYLSILYFTEHYPLSVKLSQIGQGIAEMSGTDSRGIRMAGCLMFALPMLIMYTILQKKFVASIDRVGIVG